MGEEILSAMRGNCDSEDAQPEASWRLQKPFPIGFEHHPPGGGLKNLPQKRLFYKDF
jgi:hypothetical protein